MNEILDAFLSHMTDRLTEGPRIRLLLQPSVAALLAVTDGLRDARRGRRPYLHGLAVDRRLRGARLRHGWDRIARVFLVAMAVDGVYQIATLKTVHPLEAVVVAAALALAPYVLLRGPVNRIARRAGIRRRRRP